MGEHRKVHHNAPGGPGGPGVFNSARSAGLHPEHDKWSGPAGNGGKPQPAPSSTAAPAVNPERYRLVIAITSGIERDGAVEVQEDPGHAVVFVIDAQAHESSVLSYGPRDLVNLAMMEKSLGDPAHAIKATDLYVGFRWNISEKGYEAAKAYIGARTLSPEVYDAQHQCTTEAMEVAKRAGVVLPSAAGKLRYSKDRIVQAATPASLLRNLRARREGDLPLKTFDLIPGYFLHHGLTLVDQ